MSKRTFLELSLDIPRPHSSSTWCRMRRSFLNNECITGHRACLLFIANWARLVKEVLVDKENDDKVFVFVFVDVDVVAKTDFLVQIAAK